MSDNPISNTSDVPSGLDIAVVGMAGRFPGARNLQKFWQNLCDGVESIACFADEDLAANGVSPEMLTDPNYVKSGSLLDDVELFDAQFFGFYAREAEITDPQQRLFLECAWEAIEQAGYNPETYPGLIGTYAGTGKNIYFLCNLFNNQEIRESVSDYQLMIGSEKDFVATRVSYKLNLRGPSVNIQSACSTSLVAIHLACQSLLNYQCDVALAGGASLTLLQKRGYHYQEGGILSRDGHCRAFDAKASGTVNGNGVGVVVLKRLADALVDGDTIYAIIKGSAINNDGSLKVGYTAPSVDGQAEVIATAQAVAGVTPRMIGYIEAHGTGTVVGDPIEISALSKVFRQSTDAKRFCAIGSVKTNIGHADAAAGVAGLIKTILALKHKQIPPSLHFEEPNPAIDFTNGPFYVNTKLSDWKTDGSPRRAGVSSFGIGGTNAHMVLEEAPVVEPSGPSRAWQLLLLSARTQTALDAMAINLAKHLRANPGVNLADVAHTLQVGRKVFNQRRMVVCRDLEEGAKLLETVDAKRNISRKQERVDRPVAFMLTGQGSQYAGMTQDLYEAEPTFRAQVDACSDLLKAHLGLDLREVIYPKGSRVENRASKAEGRKKSDDASINQTWLTQPALFVTEYALAKLWMQWGIKPQVMIGHSIGEYVAACLGGVLSLEDALALVAARGRLMQELPGGAMLSIALDEKQVRSLLSAQLSIAAVNAPSLCVVSGPPGDVDALERRLEAQGTASQRLRTSHAFHSAMMDSILDSFTRLAERIKLQAPVIPFVSSVTGQWITAAEATDPSYWARQLRQTVRFGEGVRELMKDTGLVLLEVGPGGTLATLARMNMESTHERVVLSSLRRPQDQQSDIPFILGTIGQLSLAGVPIDWSGFYAHERRQRLALPTYPFERQRYWIDPGQQASTDNERQAGIRKRSDIASWLYVPSWKRADLSLAARRRDFKDTRKEPPLLVIGDGCGLGRRLAERLVEGRRDVVTVLAGSGFAKVDHDKYTLRACEESDYDHLINELREGGQFPETIVHLWNAATDEESPVGSPKESSGLYSLLPLVRSLGRQNLAVDVRILVVSTQVHEVTGEESICAKRATLLGACKVTPQEYPNITCQNIDVVAPESDFQVNQLLDQLLGELLTQTADVVSAYRNNHRWVQTYEPMRLDEVRGTASRLREGGVYLITGGLERIGLMCAEYLARKTRARLILVGPAAFPAKEEWDRWLVVQGLEDETSRTIERLRAMELLGVNVMVISADVGNEEQMSEVVRLANARFGALNGVIHSATSIGGEGFSKEIHEIGRDDVELHFRPKVQGLNVLANVLREQELDFFLLESSLSVVLGGVGLAAYAAANAFMDAFAQNHNQSGSVPWLIVNWDHWVFEAPVGHHLGAHELAFTSKEGEAILEHVLALDAPMQIIVSTGDLEERISQWVARRWRQEQSDQAQMRTLRARADNQSAHPAARDAVEAQLTQVWEKLLGVSPIGIHDNFFDLGGHSLLAIQIVSRVHDIFNVDLSISSLLASPTVADMAAMVVQRQAEMTEPDKLADDSEELAIYSE